MPDIPFIIETKAKSLQLSSHPQPFKKKIQSLLWFQLWPLIWELSVAGLSGSVWCDGTFANSTQSRHRYLAIAGRTEGRELPPSPVPSLPPSLPEMNAPNTPCLPAYGEKKKEVFHSKWLHVQLTKGFLTQQIPPDGRFMVIQELPFFIMPETIHLPSHSPSNSCQEHFHHLRTTLWKI